MQPQQGDLTQGAQLRIVTKHSEGESLVSLARDHTVQPEIIQLIIFRKQRLKRVLNAPAQRSHLPLGDKLRILHLLDNCTIPNILQKVRY